MTGIDNEDFKLVLLNVESVIMFMLMVTLKQEIIVISLENIEAMGIEIAISTLN